MATSPPILDDDELQRQLAPIIGMATLKTNTPANLPPVGVPPPDGQKPIYAPTTTRPMSGSLGMPTSLPKPRSPSQAEQQLGEAKQEHARLTDTGSGVSQLQQRHPFLGGLARVADVIGSIAAPRIA